MKARAQSWPEHAIASGARPSANPGKGQPRKPSATASSMHADQSPTPRARVLPAIRTAAPGGRALATRKATGMLP